MIHDANVARLVNHCVGRRLTLLDGALQTQRGLFVCDDPSVHPEGLLGTYRCMGLGGGNGAPEATSGALSGPYDRVACWLGDASWQERRAVVDSCAGHLAHDGVLVVSGWQPWSLFYQSCQRAQLIACKAPGWRVRRSWFRPERWGARWYATDVHRACRVYSGPASCLGSNVELTWRWLLPWWGGVFTWYLSKQTLPMVVTDGACHGGQTCREGV